MQPDEAASRPQTAVHGDPRGGARGKGEIDLRLPRSTDGPAITGLIAACPPLDRNSAYCNLVQCTHFADSCVVAERDGDIVGWVSGHRPPSDPASFFVWQVAVGAQARGLGLAGRMIEALLDRPQAAGVTSLITTVTADNRASWALFESLSRRWSAPLEKSVLFDRDIHFAGAHATEWQARIGPLPQRERQQTRQEL
ncbi:L-2,4-diaminobutyric acid acetyltransferase [Sphingobium sp. SYK-6]|uniref:diaminobutyrate acetyltransferase n=1 Tax=Sphingobium sp. (strain NBRC 103272 / SYK-6) TaxID=627192 RepID=UPI0002276B5C|nr:diaminobutyrate acetyltransferase [Sphingobium sp. SYK-6]BAK65479.1 L-2,4-diaminobutyric acid acetyltransferase [Sphingobium sp. SYK-6]